VLSSRNARKREEKPRNGYLHSDEGAQGEVRRRDARAIEGVCTSSGTHYTRSEVVDSINAGNDQDDGLLSEVGLLGGAVYQDESR
jgi:hypothetical protein